MSILNNDLVYGPAIHTHPHWTIFLRTRREGTTHGLRLSLTRPLAINSSTCLWIFMVFWVRSKGQFVWEYDIGNETIVMLDSFLGSRSWRMSFENT